MNSKYLLTWNSAIAKTVPHGAQTHRRTDTERLRWLHDRLTHRGRIQEALPWPGVGVREGFLEEKPKDRSSSRRLGGGWGPRQTWGLSREGLKAASLP